MCIIFQVLLEDLHWASQQLMEALHIRERYMRVSHQSFPTITSRFFHKKHPHTQNDASSPSSASNGLVLRSSDVTAAGGDQSHKSETRQPYPRARVIKHEDRQSIAGKFYQQLWKLFKLIKNNLCYIFLYVCNRIWRESDKYNKSVITIPT